MSFEELMHEQRNTDSAAPWECENCTYQPGEAPPRGLACLRCREVADIFEKLQREESQKAC